MIQEGDLQTLETKEFNTLRDEFKQQVLQLRSKVMKRIRPKTYFKWTESKWSDVINFKRALGVNMLLVHFITYKVSICIYDSNF